MKGPKSEVTLQTGDCYAERYKIVMPLGKGGMGKVYLAEDLHLNGKTRALKLINPRPEESLSFLPEARMLCELSHPHLPAIVDYYPPNQEGSACIVMEYIAGDTLAERFERYGFRLPFELVLKYMIDLCEVLVYLHAQKPAIVFRDLKPSNVLLDQQDRAILVDFGIARRHIPEASTDTLQLGTPGFAAPEQFKGQQSDARTDLFNLGAMVYHLLTGGHFAIRHQGSMRKALQKDVPPAFSELLERLLAVDPRERPQSANQLRDDLVQFCAIANRNLLQQSHDKVISKSSSKLIAVLSAYPGAGATFVSIALSAVLNRKGLIHALVESPGSEPELFTRLDGARTMPRDAVFAASAVTGTASTSWKQGSAFYYPMNPEYSPIPKPDKVFEEWLDTLKIPLIILDVSSCWDKQDVMFWLGQNADQIYFVADCFPAKWSIRRQENYLDLQKIATQHDVPVKWLANRDQPFPARKQWLNLLPSRPLAYIPELPGFQMLSSLWNGEGVPSDARSVKELDASFQMCVHECIRI